MNFMSEVICDARAQKPSLVGIIYGDTSKNRRKGFSSLKFFISAGVHKFVII